MVLIGTGPRTAARQAALLFVIAGLLAVLAIANDPGRWAVLLVVAGCDLGVALVSVLLPWARLHPYAPAVLGLAGFAILGVSTWTFGGVATGTGPFMVLLYAWAALHFPRWILLAFAAPALLAYLLPLIVTRQPPVVLGSALILLPVALSVALLIEAQARHLRDDRERLARIESWRSAMMSTLAHDVRSPLTSVRIALEEMSGHATGPLEWMLASALRQTARVTRLADGLLDMQRIDSTGHLTLDRRTVAARPLIEEAVSYVRTADVTVEVADDQTLYVDTSRFEQIVVNLVGNALRYGRPPVVVRVSTGDGMDRLEVRDHGPGIPESLRARLFTEFAVGGPEGVGLGLWIVRRLAEVHGGWAVAEDRDPGVAMIVAVPAREPVRAGPSPRGTPGSAVPAG